MAQLPASMRRRKKAVSSIHEKPPTRLQKIIDAGGWLFLCIAILVLVFGVYGLYSLIKHAKTAQLSIVGVPSAVAQQQIDQQVQPALQGSYFTANLAEVRDQALKLPWVDNVVVSRAWPNNIRVRVIAKHPVARWGTGRLLSDNGDIYSEVSPEDHTNLPLLHGPINQSQTMMRRYDEINQLFKPIGLHLKELYLTERMTWFMQFDSGLRVIVDQDQTMTKLQRLSYLAQRDLKPVWNNITAIDLRYRNGMALQWKNATPPPILNSHFVVTNNDLAVASTGQEKP